MPWIVVSLVLEAAAKVAAATALVGALIVILVAAAWMHLARSIRPADDADVNDLW